MDISIITVAVSDVLLIGLMFTYARVYNDTRAQFRLGLMVFALILFAQNVLLIYSLATMATYIGTPFLPYLLTINIVQLFGIIMLFRMTRR